MENEKIKEHVKKRYGEIAKTECSSCSSSCCSSSCGLSAPPQYVAWKLGYSPDDIENVPEDSVLGLGCGNPVALATLKEGETVLDLGSGGGIEGRTDRKGDWRGYDNRNGGESQNYRF